MNLSFAICLFFVQQVAAPAAEDVKVPGAEKAVLATYKRMEQADRKGDGELWFTLRDRKTLEAMDPALKAAIKKGGHARPKVQYEPSAIRVQGTRAVLIGKVFDPDSGSVQYDTVLFAVEDQEWKVSREQFSESPFDPFVLSALMPPEDGAFMRAAEPWKRITYAGINTQVVKLQNVVWKVQATRDESFLYVRFEALSLLAPPGSKVTPQAAKSGNPGGLPPSPTIRVKLGDDRAFLVSVRDLVSTKGIIDKKGKSAGDRNTIAYSLFVKNGAGEDIYESTIGDDTVSKLLAVQGKFIDVKLPLSGMGVGGGAAIALEEADAVMQILPFTVEAFTGKE
jgi:hypothetical protein